MNRDVPKGLIIVGIIVGTIFFFGSTIYKLINNYNHRNYIETTATFIQTAGKYTSDDGTNMYYLIYKYIINEQEYYYTTDYVTNDIPQKKSTIKIKYNPVNPKQAYSKSFDVFSVFQIIGAFFLVVSLIILFSEWIWFRDILIFIGTISLITTFIINNFYTGGFIIVIIILGIMCLGAVIDFIKYLKNNRFEPLKDIKEEIKKSKQMKLIKNEKKRNLTIEEKEIKNEKMKRIRTAILLILTVPLDIFIGANGWCPNETIYMILVLISGICFLIGFFIIGMILFDAFDNKDSVTVIAGKVIDNEDIQNIKKMTLSEKIKAFNIIGVILRILAVPACLGLFILMLEDPLNLFNVFVDVGSAKIIATIILAIILNALFLFFPKNKHSKISITITIIIESIITCYFFYYLLYLA